MSPWRALALGQFGAKMASASVTRPRTRCVGSMMKALLSNERHRETLRVYRKFRVLSDFASHILALKINVHKRKSLLRRRRAPR